jgi:F-type H+-transporting ATPase subunit delta
MTDLPAHHETVLDVGDLGLARTYAIALLDAAQEGSARIDDVRQQVSALGELISTMPELLDPLLPVHELQQALAGALVDRVLPVVSAFVSILTGRGRLSLLPAIGGELKRLQDHRDGKVEVVLVTAHPLNDEQVGTVKAKLEKSIKAPIVLARRVDPTMVGGAKVTVDGRTYDASLATGLRDIKQHAIHRLRERRLAEKHGESSSSD